MRIAGISSEQLTDWAKAEGFDLCGVVALPRTGDPAYPESGAYQSWITGGQHGDMQYLAAQNDDGELKRAAVGNAAPWARSAVVVALNYNSDAPYSVEVGAASGISTRGWISRYAWFEAKAGDSQQPRSNTDYHDAFLSRLRQLEKRFLQSADQRGAPLKTWCYVDTGPIAERVLAKYAGIGWIGKNCCIIHPDKGSWLFLGEMLVSADVERDTPMPLQPDRCGTCTRCIEACPTHAITEPYKIDARLCISYLTIEKRGAIPEELRQGMGNHIFGCDICQDVCPWNGAENVARKPPASPLPEFQPRQDLFSPELQTLARMSREDFNVMFRHSPLKRVKYDGFRRNVAIAMGNSGQREFLPLLQEMVGGEDVNVAEHARRAIAQLEDVKR